MAEVENPDDVLEHLVLDEDGAKAIFISVDDGMLDIDGNVFSPDEAIKLRDFITRNFGSGNGQSET